MKLVIIFLLVSLSLSSFGQEGETLPEKKKDPDRRKLEVGINFTSRSQNLGIGLTTGSNYFTSYNMYIGIGFELYYKHFNNNTIGVKVMNLSTLVPVTIGYKFSKEKFFAIPYGGLFGGAAWQSQIYNDGTSKNVFIADWGYTLGIKTGFNLGKVWPFLRVAYYNNFDGDKTDGHFFRAVPVSVGILYARWPHRKYHRHHR